MSRYTAPYGQTIMIMSNTLRQPAQHPPDAKLGLGPILYALDKLNDQFGQQESQRPRDVLTNRPYGDPALCALFLRDNIGDTAGETDGSGRGVKAEERVELTGQTKKRFITIMLRVSRSHEGISRGERAFIRLFWRALQQRQPEEQLLTVQGQQRCP